MTALRYARSVLTAESVGELVADQYGLDVVAGELVRSLVNEVYVVDTAEGRCAVKVYRQSDAPRAWTLPEVIWEQQLALALLESGLAVPAPVPLTSGELAGELAAPEGARPFAVTRWVGGSKPQLPRLSRSEADDLYRDFGTLTARFHAAATDLVSPHKRRPVEPLSELSATAGEVAAQLSDPADRDLVLAQTESALTELGRLADSGLTRGVRHGDVSLDNLLRTDSGLGLHDFDRSGPGWLAADLTGVRSTDHWSAFLAGYRQVLSLTQADLAALAPLTVLGLVANLRFHLIDKPLVFGAESRGEGWVERELSSLRKVLTGK